MCSSMGWRMGSRAVVSTTRRSPGRRFDRQSVLSQLKRLRSSFSSGGFRVQEVDGGMTLDEWFASQADLGVGLDGYFTTLGGKVLNSKVDIGSLGLGSFQEVVFHCRLRGGANKGSGRVDSPNLGEWQCSFCMAPHCWQTKMACYRCGTPRYWESGVMGQGSPRGFTGKGGGFAGSVSGPAAGFFGQGSVANAMGGARIIGPTGRDQTYVPRGEPTFRKGGGAKGGGKGGMTLVLVSGANSCQKSLVVLLVRWVKVQERGRCLLVRLRLIGIRRSRLYRR